MSATTDSPFIAGYAAARSAFLAAARRHELAIESHRLPMAGADGEELAIDVARQGPIDAQSLLVISSGCHGIEGPAGSMVQRVALEDTAWRRRAAQDGIALLWVHALNPYGWSHQRRVTHENVDLNRNFHDFGGPLPANEAYRELHALLLPRRWPPGAMNWARLLALLGTRGLSVLQRAVSGGQHEFEDGMFYGGQAPTWNNRVLRSLLRRHGEAARRIAWVDIHTGLGPRGVGERIWSGRADAAGIARARRWWDSGGRTPVTSLDDGSSVSARLTGLMCHAVYQECPRAQYTGIGLEFGTVPLLAVLQALRGDHWLHMHAREAPAALARRIHARMARAFAPQDERWQVQVLAQSHEALAQAVRGLAEN